MLKRAVFGVFGASFAPRGSRDSAPLGALPTTATVKRPPKSESTSQFPQRKGKYTAEVEEESDLFEEIDTHAAEPHADSDEDAGCEASEDPKIRKALIRRAAALYAQDREGFLRAMQKHEQPGGEDEEQDIELLDPESDQSGAEGTAEKRIHGGNTDVELPMGLEQEELAQDELFTRGKFHCKLCPKKIFIFEADLEKHLESKVHKRKEKQWEKLQHGSHLDSARDAEARAAEGTSRTKMLEADDEIKRESKNGKRTKLKRSERRRNVDSLTCEEIQRRKEKFQRKKQRRLERKNSTSAS